MPSAAYYSGRLRSLRGYRARIEFASPAPRVEATRTFSCNVKLTNVGDRTWRRAGWHPVHLAYHWCSELRRVEGGRFDLPADLRPGDHVTVACTILAPSEMGHYELEFDLVRELVGWFSDGGAPPLRLQVAVDDYDYDTTYRDADLERDYWTVVGPTSKEEYEFLGRDKRKTLIALGMTSDSRLLDVGCGTGQLAEALQDYLSDDAVYYGTDLSETAVEFCRGRFRRPNFYFRKNEMTSVDAEGRQFDVIFLSSVFTHMYPDEVAAMLVELRRLLAPGGMIVADVFLTPEVGTFRGNRAWVEINQAHLIDRIRATGLRHEIYGEIPYPDGRRRVGFKFTEHRA